MYHVESFRQIRHCKVKEIIRICNLFLTFFAVKIAEKAFFSSGWPARPLQAPDADVPALQRRKNKLKVILWKRCINFVTIF